MNVIGKSVVLLLGAYKRAISPRLMPACRYVPTCSEYAAQAVEVHGAGRGILIALWRLLRCHPFTPGGYDPVPSPSHPHSEGGGCGLRLSAHRKTMFR